MLSSRVIEPGNPPESYALPGFSPEQESPRRPEALPLDTAPPVRTIPTYHELIGAGTLYGVVSPGYQDAYFSKPASGSVKELLLTPDWVDDIDSQRMRADRFYRSLAGLMISIPLTVIASDMTDSEAGTLFFHTAVSLNITAAVSTLIDLFRYTNYLL